VGGPDVIRITTSRGQGQAREGLSEGSPSAKVRADGQKSHRRLGSGASQHHMTKPAVSRGRVNAAVVHRRRMFLFGESCATSGPCGYESRTEARLKSLDVPSNPKVTVIATGVGLRATTKGVEYPPDPTVIRAAHSVVTPRGDCTAVSRRRSSQTPIVMGGTR